jgi:hypothetical protein
MCRGRGVVVNGKFKQKEIKKKKNQVKARKATEKAKTLKQIDAEMKIMAEKSERRRKEKGEGGAGG